MCQFAGRVERMGVVDWRKRQAIRTIHKYPELLLWQSCHPSELSDYQACSSTKRIKPNNRRAFPFVEVPSSVLVALDRAQRARGDVVVTTGLDITGTTGIACGWSTKKHKLARISQTQAENILPEATTVAIRNADGSNIVHDGAAVQVVCSQSMS